VGEGSSSHITRFSDIIGQAGALGRLKGAVSSGRLPHALLFCGLEGTGRRTTARALAARLNCLRPSGDDACGECVSCGKMARGVHPDFRLIEPELQDIKEEQVAKDLIPRLYFPPAEGKVRVSVLAPAERLNETSANNLLKVLEEPPRGNLLILCCREPGAVLQTIASRCQTVFLEPLATQAVQGWLEARGVSPEQARLAAYLSGGSLSRAQRLTQPEAWEKRRVLLEAIPGLAELPTPDVLALAGELSGAPKRGHDALEKARERLRDLLGALASLLRDGLVLGATGEAVRVVNVDFMPAVEAVASGGSVACLTGLDLIEESERAVSANCDPQLTLETLLLGLGRKG